MTVERGIHGGRKTREGVVISDRMEKTIVVAVQSNIRHPLYKKIIRRVHKFMAHDEDGQARTGDRVRIVEAAPTSRRKRWQLAGVLSRVELPEVAPESIDLDILGEVKPEEEPTAEASAEVEEVAAEAAPAQPGPADEVAPDESAVVAEAEEPAPEATEQEPAGDEETAGEPVADVEPEADVEPKAGGAPDEAAEDASEEAGDDAAAEAGEEKE